MNEPLSPTQHLQLLTLQHELRMMVMGGYYNEENHDALIKDPRVKVALDEYKQSCKKILQYYYYHGANSIQSVKPQ